MQMDEYIGDEVDEIDELLNTINSYVRNPDMEYKRKRKKAVFEETNQEQDQEPPVGEEHFGDVPDWQESKQTLDFYKEQDFNQSQLKEIELGFESKVAVERYAKTCYSWKQMREIRMGLESGFDTSIYQNPFFCAEQMREIRLGMVYRVEYKEYAKLYLAVSDMDAKRREQMAKWYIKRPEGYEKTFVDRETGMILKVSDDAMQATAVIPNPHRVSINPQMIKEFMRDCGIVYGYMEKDIIALSMEEYCDTNIVVADGKRPTIGDDGWYECFFEDTSSMTPVVLEDGSVDFSNMKIAETVQQGHKIVQYHSAKEGGDGMTIYGFVVPGRKGRDIPPLTGKGIYTGFGEGSYFADCDGHVTYNKEEGTLDVRKLYVIDGDVNRYNGNIAYDGSIHFRGAVGENVKVKAAGDIIIDGFAEGCFLQADKDIIIRGGVNAGGKGMIQANGKVMGSFFEAANIKSKGKVEGNYFLNCNIETDDKVVARGKKSRILGGNVKAAVCVESVVLGNYGSTRTTIDVGDIPSIDKRTEELKKQVEKINYDIDKLSYGRDKLEHAFKGKDLSDNDLYNDTCDTLEKKYEQLEQTEYEIKRLATVRNRAIKAYIKGYGEIQQGLIVGVCGRKHVIEKKMRGTTINMEWFLERSRDS